MKTNIYASAEDRNAELLYERLKKLNLITDKNGKPIEYVWVYPTIKELIQECDDAKIKVPKSKKIKDILLAMAKAEFKVDNVEPNSLTEKAFKAAKNKIELSSEEANMFKQDSLPPEKATGKQATGKQAEIDTELSEEEEIEAEIAAEEAELSIEEAIKLISTLDDHNDIDFFMEDEKREEVIVAARNRIKELQKIASSGKK